MTKLTVAITQMASDNDWEKNCDKAEGLVRAAAAKGAKLILLQELFDGDYFCIEQHVQFLGRAEELGKHPTVKRFAALAKELGVVLPVSFFERAGQATFNSIAIIDADGTVLDAVPRRTQGYAIARVTLGEGTAPAILLGPWIAWGAVVSALVALLWALARYPRPDRLEIAPAVPPTRVASPTADTRRSSPT